VIMTAKTKKRLMELAYELDNHVLPVGVLNKTDVLNILVDFRDEVREEMQEEFEQRDEFASKVSAERRD